MFKVHCMHPWNCHNETPYSVQIIYNSLRNDQHKTK
jgi:hypothetical protein